MNEEQLLVVMTKAARKDPKTVLNLKSEAKTEFKFIRKVINIGSKAGLSQVAIGTHASKEKTSPE